MELYKSGRVSIGPNGLFKVSGFEVDTEKMQCECPDYRTRKQTCEHLVAALLFVKNQGKTIIEDLPGFTWVDEVRDMPRSYDKPQVGAKELSNERKEAHSKNFDKQATITRLAVINSAIELLKTHRKPIELTEVLSLASQLETWALDIKYRPLSNM